MTEPRKVREWRWFPWKWLAELPTTNARILVTLGLYIGTAWDYLHNGDKPDWDWLLFLMLSAGLDVIQWKQKRETLVQTGAPDIEDAKAGARIDPEVTVMPASSSPQTVPLGLVSLRSEPSKYDDESNEASR